MQMTTITNEILDKPVLKVWVSSNEISVAKLKARDTEAFKSFYKFYAPAIYGSIMRKVKDEAKCNLVLEQTFTQAWEMIANYDGANCSLFIWLNRIANKLSVIH